jgi:hypothetical protein
VQKSYFVNTALFDRSWYIFHPDKAVDAHDILVKNEIT